MPHKDNVNVHSLETLLLLVRKTATNERQQLLINIVQEGVNKNLHCYMKEYK